MPKGNAGRAVGLVTLICREGVGGIIFSSGIRNGPVTFGGWAEVGPVIFTSGTGIGLAIFSAGPGVGPAILGGGAGGALVPVLDLPAVLLFKRLSAISTILRTSDTYSTKGKWAHH